jgi:hypothetical protein
MGTLKDHRECAQECVARARLAQGPGDRALWLTLAQSWVQLGEQFASAEAETSAPEDLPATVA